MNKLIRGTPFVALFIAVGFSLFSYLSNADKVFTPEHFLTIAHRGASAYAPENTLPSFELAKRMRVDYIELDLQMTKDGYLLVIHDEKLDRTTNGKGWVKDYTLAQIKKLDAGSWFIKLHPEKANLRFKDTRVITLEELLQHFGKTVNYYIEPKSPELYPHMEQKVVQILKKYHLIGSGAKYGQVILQSFSPDSLKKIHAIDPNIPLVQLYEKKPIMTDQQIDEIKKYAIGVGPDFKKIDELFTRKVRKQGLLVHVYTVNEASDMKRMISWGVTGIFTNYPDHLKEIKP